MEFSDKTIQVDGGIIPSEVLNNPDHKSLKLVILVADEALLVEAEELAKAVVGGTIREVVFMKEPNLEELANQIPGLPSNSKAFSLSKKNMLAYVITDLTYPAFEADRAFVKAGKTKFN